MSTIVFIEKLYFNSNCRFRLCSHYTGELFLSPRKAILYSMNNNDAGRHKSFTHIEYRASRGGWPRRFDALNSKSSLLNIYFLLSGFQASLPFMYFYHGPNRCSHCNKQ